MNKAHFAAVAAHHEAMSKAHTEMAAYIKAKQEGLDDDDVHKAFYSKMAEHETACSNAHKAMCDHNKAMESECDKAVAATDLTKGAPAAPPAAPPVTKSAPTPAASTDPAAAPAAPPADPKAEAAAGVQDLVKSTTDALVKEALGQIKSDPTIGDSIRKLVLEQVTAALSGTIVPSSVKGVIPQAPDNTLRLVPHNGQPSIDTSSVDPEFADMVGT